MINVLLSKQQGYTKYPFYLPVGVCTLSTWSVYWSLDEKRMAT